jgi:hypothetical protein
MTHTVNRNLHTCLHIDRNVGMPALKILEIKWFNTVSHSTKIYTLDKNI